MIVEVWIDGINGSDTNSGLSASAPLKTRGKLYEKYPAQWLAGDRLLSHWAGVGGFGPNATAPLLYDDTQHLLVHGGGEMAVNTYSYRAADRVPWTPPTGPQYAALDTGTPASNITAHRTRLYCTQAQPGWTAGAHTKKLLRIKRSSVLVHAEIPIARNGVDWMDLDHPGFVGKVQAGDVISFVQPSVQFKGSSTDNLYGLIVAGGGGPYWNYQNKNGCTFEGVEFQGGLFCRGAWGLSFDRSIFNCETNLMGGSAHLVNCAVVTMGLMLQGGFSNVHDTPGCRSTSTSDPIYQGAAEPQMELLANGADLVIGHRMGGMACAYTVERNISVYNGVKSGLVVEGPGTIFYVQKPTEVGGRTIAIQGEGNAIYGIDARYGALARMNPGSASSLVGGTPVGGVQYDHLHVEAGNSITWDELNDVNKWNGVFSRRLEKATYQGYDYPRGQLSCITNL